MDNQKKNTVWDYGILGLIAFGVFKLFTMDLSPNSPKSKFEKRESYTKTLDDGNKVKFQVWKLIDEEHPKGHFWVIDIYDDETGSKKIGDVVGETKKEAKKAALDFFKE